jgi:peptidoglycan/xylan/chitin deacetylase (PgdA/CDA1 family)
VTGALAITIDVDGEAGLPDGGRGAEALLSTRSERLYGIARGLPRLLRALADAAVPATFFLPGVTAERHPEAVASVAAGGHESALHGHSHRRLDAMTATEQAADLEAGLDAFAAVAGRTPAGYRAPGWELTPHTLDLLAAHGFAYDSSLMGDDRPYTIATAAGPLLELPVHWSLDDAPHFARGGSAGELRAVWIAELELAVAEERLLTVTLHPEILGRPHRVAVLERLLDRARELRCPTVTLAAAAAARTDSSGVES